MSRKKSWLSTADSQQVELDIVSNRWIITRIYMWRTKVKAYGANAPKYKVVPTFYSNRGKAKREKNTIKVTNQGSRLYDSKVWSRKGTIRNVWLTRIFQ